MISPLVTDTILRRVAQICPEMVDHHNPKSKSTYGFDVRQVYVARRPMRIGGLRLEKESFHYIDTGMDGLSVREKAILVVHCYGAGANGYKISWEVARQVEKMIP